MKRIKLKIRNNILIRKLLILKGLILGKHDIIIASVKHSEQCSNERFQASSKRFQDLQASIDCLTENQVFLLKSSIDTVHAVHKSFSSITDLSAQIGETSGLFQRSNQSLGSPSKHQIIDDFIGIGEIETGLICYLYSYLPCRVALDVGANRGDVAERLLQAGYEVYAFEPFPPVLERLQQRLAYSPNFHAIPYPLGAVDETRDFHFSAVSADLKNLKRYDDITFYNSLLPHSLGEGLVFQESIPVTVRTLAGLHRSNQIPSQVGLVKIDTEGWDLDVIKGTEEYRYPVVMIAFWDPSFPSGHVGARNSLNEMVPVMRERGYSWHIVVYRISAEARISFYCNSMHSFKHSWGNVLFFRDHTVFLEALKWCNVTMSPTFFAG
jgi:FkbM family methyltransferase